MINLRYLDSTLYLELSGPDVSINELKFADVIEQIFKSLGAGLTSNSQLQGTD